jgi:hypothetical protein
VVSAPTIPHLFDDGRIVVTSEHLKQLLRNQQRYYGGSFCDLYIMFNVTKYLLCLVKERASLAVMTLNERFGVTSKAVSFNSER